MLLDFLRLHSFRDKTVCKTYMHFPGYIWKIDARLSRLVVRKSVRKSVSVTMFFEPHRSQNPRSQKTRNINKLRAIFNAINIDMNWCKRSHIMTNIFSLWLLWPEAKSVEGIHLKLRTKSPGGSRFNWEVITVWKWVKQLNKCCLWPWPLTLCPKII